MEIHVNDGYFNKGKVTIKISFGQWLRLKICGSVKVFDAKLGGWLNENSFFIFECPFCGEYALSYKHGLNNDKLRCSECVKHLEFQLQELGLIGTRYT